MITGFENIIKLIRINGHSGFRVRLDSNADVSSAIFCSQRGESLDKAIERFREVMSMYEGSGQKFYAEAWTGDSYDDQSSKKGRLKEWFKVDAVQEHAAPSAITGPPVVHGISRDEMEERIAGVRKEMQTDFELQKMKEELAELKEENKELNRRHESAWEQLVQRASPYIGYILQAVVPKTAQVGLAGMEPVSTAFETPEINTEIEDMDRKQITPEELQSILLELAELEPELPRILKGALNFVKGNKVVYEAMVRPKVMEYLCQEN